MEVLHSISEWAFHQINGFEVNHSLKEPKIDNAAPDAVYIFVLYI